MSSERLLIMEGILLVQDLIERKCDKGQHFLREMKWLQQARRFVTEEEFLNEK